MTYNTKVLVGLAAILLVAVVFAQPSWGAAQETYSTIIGYGDMTGYITNPSFESDTLYPGQFKLNTYAGWSLNNGSSGSGVVRPLDPSYVNQNFSGAPYVKAGYALTGAQTIGATPQGAIPGPLELPGETTATSVSPPRGYLMQGDDGTQVLATWRNAFIAQTLTTSPGKNFTTAAHQSYVMTWEFGMPSGVGNAWGVTVGVWYGTGTSSVFMQINDDTSFGTGVPGGHYGTTAGYLYQYAWSFTTDASSSYQGKTMSIRLGGGTVSGTGYNYFDNIHVYGVSSTGIIGTALPTPEPSTVALLVTGALGMLAYAWRRKRRK
jgi:hypothetical protein